MKRILFIYAYFYKNMYIFIFKNMPSKEKTFNSIIIKFFKQMMINKILNLNPLKWKLKNQFKILLKKLLIIK